MTRRVFGTTQDGTAIEAVALAAGGIVAEVITLGAVVRDLRLTDPGGAPRSVVLGLETVADYEAHSPHMGAIAGRYANRIGGGRLLIDGVLHQLSLNQSGRHHLHGGHRGFGRRPWEIAGLGPDWVALRIVSADGEEGYPGNVEATCVYRLDGGTSPALIVELTARTDAPTVVNLAHHGYFDLDGGPDVLDHRLRIDADAYTPVDKELIPTGAIRPVAGTPFDFRTIRPIRMFELGERVKYDINFVLADAPREVPQMAARLEAAKSGWAMEVLTTEPGLQFYDGAKLAVPVPGLGGRIYGPSSGLCLEPQRFPDSPNHENFTNAVLRPGETYQQTTIYRFSRM